MISNLLLSKKDHLFLKYQWEFRKLDFLFFYLIA
ncbi:hypothetical protein FIC_00650 [Flavobacteriaceae bacterium 3519-10]|nr:hypothetical protein FIC_00650 [Flavobacteriaceae bacterium 3519-10]